MFYYLDGTVAHIEPYLAVIDCGGVGYACKTTNTTLGQLRKGQRGKLYTYLNVAEDVFDLYGFASQGELGSFKQLLGVSGVGPKAALAILSSVTPEGLAMAVITDDAKTLTAAPGIGKKIAQRIILELKDKVAKEQQADGFIPAAAAAAPSGGKTVEAAQALSVLGYSQSDISAALRGLDVENLSLEELVRQALRRMVQ
ncbi:MAG: Holliday junction branch migration protein RuvA [Ruminococcaceae bacterium]|nr:Holliday junction branch migration protein RuvA [Oscillospiraceae bacterium]